MVWLRHLRKPSSWKGSTIRVLHRSTNETSVACHKVTAWLGGRKDYWAGIMLGFDTENQRDSCVLKQVMTEVFHFSEGNDFDLTFPGEGFLIELAHDDFFEAHFFGFGNALFDAIDGTDFST